jgi:hypothetical protein
LAGSSEADDEYDEYEFSTFFSMYPNKRTIAVDRRAIPAKIVIHEAKL